MTKTEVVNLAIAKLGASLITSLGDVNIPGSHFGELLYKPTLERVLRDFPWSLATRESSLALLPEKKTNNWNYSYALPNDCIRFLELLSGSVNMPHDQFSKAGNYLHTNIQDVTIKYVSSDITPADFDPDFREAFVTLLASEMATPILQDPGKMQMLMNEYLSVALPKAKAVDARETGSRENHGTYRAIQQSPTVRARFRHSAERFIG